MSSHTWVSVLALVAINAGTGTVAVATAEPGTNWKLLLGGLGGIVATLITLQAFYADRLPERRGEAYPRTVKVAESLVFLCAELQTILGREPAAPAPLAQRIRRLISEPLATLRDHEIGLQEFFGSETYVQIVTLVSLGERLLNRGVTLCSDASPRDALAALAEAREAFQHALDMLNLAQNPPLTWNPTQRGTGWLPQLASSAELDPGGAAKTPSSRARDL